MISLGFLASLGTPELISLMLFIVGPLVGMFFLNNRHRRMRPECRDFRWGYLNALCAIIHQPIAIGIMFVNTNHSQIAWIIAFCIYMPLGILTLRRNKWGYVLLTIISFNPLLWIINYIYISNRWKEFIKV